VTTQRRLRVLHVGKFYPPSRGGMESVVQALCEAERGSVESQALVANEIPQTVREIVQGVPVTRVAALAKVGAVAVCPTFPWWLRKLTSDVIVVHEPNPLAIVAHALVRPSSRLLVWIHAEVVRPQWQYKAFYRPFLRRILTLADRIIVASPPMRDLAEELKDFRDKVVVIPYAIDPDQHALTPACLERVEAIRGQQQLPLALFVGRMVPYKGVDVLLRALKRVDARAILVGGGPLKATWEALAAELGVAERVQFVGEVDQPTLSALYRACDVFVLPSVTRAEAFGMVQLEAMACGKPVISTLLPSGVPWVNQHGETGLVVPPSDVDALALALKTLLADPALRFAMGERGRARVAAEFSLERMAGQTTTLYRSLVEQPSCVDDGVVTEGRAMAAQRQP
jgi:glycosyltransferase involved in cell wall biosynthesis